MSKYKENDKVVIEIKDTTTSVSGKKFYYPEYHENCAVYPIDENNILGKLEDFQQKPKKIKFTPEMKTEFDRLRDCDDLLGALENVKGTLDHWLFNNGRSDIDNLHQCEFARAWFHPSLIEVVELEKHTVKVGDQYLYLATSGLYGFFAENLFEKEKYTHSLEEVKEAEKQLGIQGLQAKWQNKGERNQ